MIDVPLAAQVRPLSAITGTPFSGILATFSDGNAGGVSGDYTAQIDWGKGQTTSGTIAADPSEPGRWDVAGNMIYQQIGSFPIIVTITDIGGASAVAQATATAGMLPTASGTSSQASAGVSFNTVVATIEDQNPGEQPSDFTANIDWGDSHQSTGLVTSDSANAGRFRVLGTSGYAQAGSYPVSVGLVRRDGLSLSAAGTVAVSAAPDAALSALPGIPIAAQANVKVSTQVAAFRDADPAATTADFTVTIHWGDGTSSTGAVVDQRAAAGQFAVFGSHTYAMAGGNFVASQIDDVAGAKTAASTSALVSAGASIQSISGVGLAVNSFELSPLSGVAVATFTLSGGSEPAGDFSATINWGDGATSAGSIAVAGGTYTVSGSHTYADEHVYPVAVAISGGGLMATVTTQATILEELLPDGTRGTANQRYVMEIYRDVLHRAAEQGGLDYWTAKLDAGESHGQLAYEIVQLALPREEQRDEVQALYETYLHRAPDPGGLQAWTALLYSGGTDEELAQILVSSPEYLQTHGSGTKDGFLDALFQDALGREVDASGRAYFDAAMAKGATPASVAAIIFGSDEYRRNLVSGFYQAFLDRPLDPVGVESFVGQLAGGQRDEQIIAEMVASDEFFAKTAE